MNKEFIPYEESLKLKELGFDEPCFATYRQWDGREPYLHLDTDIEADNFTIECDAPLYQQVFRWFREKYGLYHSIGLDNSLEDDVNCDYQIINHNQSISEFETDFKSYEEAELACLKKLIEIVKTK
jgi:hypothetical protein